MEIRNLFSQVPEPGSQEYFEELVKTEHIKIERIVSHGHASPPGFWYDQELDEWVMVLQGSAGLRCGEAGEVLILGPGDAVYLGAHEKHRVEWTDPDGPTVWLAIHF